MTKQKKPSRKLGGWVPVGESLPEPGVSVLAFVQKAHQVEGKTLRIRAQYAPPKTLEHDGDVDFGDYDEETGTYWCPEGWYGSNEFEETHWSIMGDVTHWMPLPPPPML